MMKKNLKYILLSILILGLSLGGVWAWVMWDGVSLSYFRTCKDSVSQSLKGVNLQGLSDLPVSGSNRIIFDDLKSKLKDVKGRIYIVDLTGGGQTYYKGIYPIDFFGLDSKHPELLKYQLRRWWVMGSQGSKPEDFIEEEHVVKSQGFEYINLYQRRRDTPAGDMVDRLISLVQNLPEGSWLHLHCRGGKGRTTSLMVMIDILKNGRQVPLEDIVKRHHLLGGINLFDTKVWKNGTYTKDQLIRRKQFIEDFYKYVNDPQGYGRQSWVQWCETNNVKSYVKLN